MPVKSLLISFTLVCTLFAADKHLEQLISTANETAAHPELIHGQWSMYVINIDRDQVLLDVNGIKSLAPASNLKLVTAAGALALLGADKKFHTTIEYTGQIDPDGRLNGDLYIRGEGDPTLGSSEMDGVAGLDSLMQIWAKQIRAQGIREINGRVIGDDSYLDHMPVPGGWYWTDIGNYYGSGTSGLCINENLYYLYFKPARYEGGIAEVIRVEPEVPGLTFFNHMKTGPVGSGDNGNIYAAPWQNLQQLEGTIPAGVPEFSIKGAIPDPARFAAESLVRYLTMEQIPVSAGVGTIRELENLPQKRNLLFTWDSPRLADIVYRLNKRSVNLYAEQLLKIVGREVEGEGSLEKGISAVENWLNEKGIYTDGLFLHDGSGLSRSNGTPTRFFAELLQVTAGEPFFGAFFNSLGIAGDPDDIGSMKTMCRGTAAAKNLRAKTGAINRVRAHSGYVRTKSGELLCFSMIANDYTGSRRTIDKLHEKLMIQMAELP